MRKAMPIAISSPTSVIAVREHRTVSRPTIRGVDFEGDRRRPAGNEGELWRALGGLKLLQNQACAQAPQPAVPDPVRYGRANAHAPLPPGSLMFVVTQVGGMPAGCDVFYEIRMHFMEPVDVNAPETVERNVVFHEAEDLAPDATAAMFGIRLDMAGSPGRQATLDAFKIYQRMRWRVRAVIGGPIMSPWGPTRRRRLPSAGFLNREPPLFGGSLSARPLPDETARGTTPRLPFAFQIGPLTGFDECGPG